MDNLEFELYKIKREIERHGRCFEFTRKEKNSYGEDVGEDRGLTIIKGLYHEQKGYVSKTTVEGANIRTKPQSMIICLLEETGILEQGDIVHINHSTYKINDITDVQNYGIICEISLEAVV